MAEKHRIIYFAAMILGIDQGTTGSTAVLIGSDGQVIGKENITFEQHYPHAGWVEHQPDDIFSSVGAAVSKTISKANVSANEIQAIGITNQRETVSLFEGDKALHPFIVWQDRRTQEICDKLSKHAKNIRRRNGTPIDPYFSSTKIQWLIKKLKVSKKNKNIRFRTIDSYLIHKLTGADMIEATNAHRTQLLSLKKVKWDSQLFDTFGVPESFAPEIIPSEGFELKTRGLSFLPDGIPICAALGDQQAALFGQLGFEKGEGKMTYGTGAFILSNTGSKAVVSKNMVSTLALQWSNGKPLYALEGSAFICGAWVQWLRDQLKMIESSSEIEALAKKAEDSNGVYIIPALTGMGAPFWKSRLRGSIEGLTRGVGREHIARASLEAMAYQNRALAEAMEEDSPSKIKWKVDGGAAKNDLLMQIQSDCMNKSMTRPQNFEATATGVAWLAGLSKGLFTLNDIKSFWKADRVFKPNKEKKKYHKLGYQNWFEKINSR